MTAPARPTETADLREAQPYVLMKRGLYWRPNGQGYTGVLAEAGRYSKEDALGWDDHCDGTSAHLASECAEFSPACWPDIQIKVLRAQRDAALAERDALATLNDTLLESHKSVAAVETALAEREARIAELEGALKPFCFGDPTLESILFGDMPDDATCTFTIKLRDTRRARAALSQGETDA